MEMEIANDKQKLNEEDDEVEGENEVHEEDYNENNEDADCRIFGVSDLHTDHRENRHIIGNWKEEKYNKKTDVILVAGDISTDLELVEGTLKTMKHYFDQVFFVPGNNELRLSKSKDPYEDSVAKFHAVLELCERIGVQTKPTKVNNVWIVPLYGWYSPSFDKNFDGDLSYQNRWLDFHKVRWNSATSKSVHSPSEYFYQFNESLISKYYNQDENDVLPVVTFSHFIPRFELLPPRIFMGNKTLTLVSGSDKIEEQIRRLGASVHLCGHIHYDFDKKIDGVRYVQNALAHPKERSKMWKKTYQPKLIYSYSSTSKNKSNEACIIN